MPPTKRRAAAQGKCECQWNDHFSEAAVPGTIRHAYGARVPKADLAHVGTSATGHQFMKCGPCRSAHTTEAISAAIKAAKARR